MGKWYVGITPCYPNEWKVTSDHHKQDNAAHNYYADKGDADREADRRNARDRISGIITEVEAELARAMCKFPTWPTDPLHALAILGEEYGELNKEVLQSVYEPHKTNRRRVREEAVQTAAMALRFIKSLDDYEYERSKQHSQGEQ